MFTPWSDVDIAAWGIRPEDTFRAIGAVLDVDSEIEVNLGACRASVREVIEHNDEILALLLQKLREQFGARLKHVILFGSRARGDHAPDSDYDCLVILDEVSSEVEDIIDEIAGEFLYQRDVVLSLFPMSEARYNQRRYSPLLMNVRKEGVVL